MLTIRTPITLEGSVIRLEPLRRAHAALFWEVAKGSCEEIFRWIPYSMKTREDFDQLVDKAFAEQERGESVVFATVECCSGRVIGSTRFMNIDRANDRVGDRLNMDRARLAAHRGQHRSQIPHAATRV